MKVHVHMMSISTINVSSVIAKSNIYTKKYFTQSKIPPFKTLEALSSFSKYFFLSEVCFLVVYLKKKVQSQSNQHVD